MEGEEDCEKDDEGLPDRVFFTGVEDGVLVPPPPPTEAETLIERVEIVEREGEVDGEGFGEIENVGRGEVEGVLSLEAVGVAKRVGRGVFEGVWVMEDTLESVKAMEVTNGEAEKVVLTPVSEGVCVAKWDIEGDVVVDCVKEADGDADGDPVELLEVQAQAEGVRVKVLMVDEVATRVAEGHLLGLREDFGEGEEVKEPLGQGEGDGVIEEVYGMEDAIAEGERTRESVGPTGDGVPKSTVIDGLMLPFGVTVGTFVVAKADFEVLLLLEGDRVEEKVLGAEEATGEREGDVEAVEEELVEGVGDGRIQKIDTLPLLPSVTWFPSLSPLPPSPIPEAHPNAELIATGVDKSLIYVEEGRHNED